MLSKGLGLGQIVMVCLRSCSDISGSMWVQARNTNDYDLNLYRLDSKRQLMISAIKGDLVFTRRPLNFL